MVDLTGKRVQIAGSATEYERALVGLVRELRVDLDNDSLRLHDGVKSGGYEFLNRDYSDGRYQRRSLELDGFNFGAQEKGILVRVSPANYKLRKIVVNEGNLKITNPRGTAGDFVFELAATITTDHTVSGVWTFTQPIAADGGVVGNVTGDLTGDSFGTHTGDVIGDTTGTHTGDVDVRGAQFLTDDGQILEEQIDPAAWVKYGVPYGGIIMWAGLVTEIPESWALCDGDNGTPDLRNRFVIGAGDDYEEGQVGGSTTATGSGTIEASGAHTHPDIEIEGHTLTIDEIPAHKHLDGVCNGNSGTFNHGVELASPPATLHIKESAPSASSVEGYTTETGGGESHTHNGNVPESGDHTHELTLEGVNVMPPYYALCYIMKIG